MAVLVAVVLITVLTWEEEEEGILVVPVGGCGRLDLLAVVVHSV
jgi:hypothetical protein